MASITIRQAVIADSKIISDLIARNAQSLLLDEFEEGGLDFFLRTVEHRAIRDYMEQGFSYLVAQEGSDIVGVIAMKDFSHMFHLFVDEQHQHKGIAKKLWHAIYGASYRFLELWASFGTLFAVPPIDFGRFLSRAWHVI